VSEQRIDQPDLNSAWNRCTSLPHSYETSGDDKQVQWAAKRVIAALGRLDLEIRIANQRRTAAQSSRVAAQSRHAAAELAKLRGRQTS